VLLPEVFFWYSLELDYAIIACEAPDVDIHPIPFFDDESKENGTTFNVAKNDELVIPQFPGLAQYAEKCEDLTEQKKWMKRSGERVSSIGRVKGFYEPAVSNIKETFSKIIGQVFVSMDPQWHQRIEYDANTLPGSSGSPIFNAAGNLVGLHSCSFSNTDNWNRGITTQRIYDHLKLSSKLTNL